MHQNQFCFWHAPEKEEEAAEARRIGGLRRRREKALSGAYDLGGLATVPDIRRILDVALLDTAGLENSIARNRLLVAIAMAATRLLEVGELETRLGALEAARPTMPRLTRGSLLDATDDGLDIADEDTRS